MTTIPSPSIGALRTSALLEDFARRLDDDQVRLGDLVALLGNRSFGLLLLLLALPNLVPLPPGSSTIFGIPLLLLSGQMMLGWPAPWVPRWLLDRSMPRETFLLMLERVLPRMRWIERWLRPRLPGFTGLRAERLLGGYCALQAFVLTLPLPFANLPPALTIALLALGLLERDGRLVLVGSVVGLFSAAIGVLALIAALKLLLIVFGVA